MLNGMFLGLANEEPPLDAAGLFLRVVGDFFVGIVFWWTAFVEAVLRWSLLPLDLQNISDAQLFWVALLEVGILYALWRMLQVLWSRAYRQEDEEEVELDDVPADLYASYDDVRRPTPDDHEARLSDGEYAVMTEEEYQKALAAR